MKKTRFPMLNALIQLFLALTVGLLEKLCILLYCLLPIGLFMLIMSSRTKNHKATAIGTYTNERSEFQHIFPNYILVIVEPKLMQKSIDNKIKVINAFVDKYKWIFLLLFFFLLTGFIWYIYLLK
jgi:hypothetical protein